MANQQVRDQRRLPPDATGDEPEVQALPMGGLCVGGIENQKPFYKPNNISTLQFILKKLSNSGYLTRDIL